MRKRPAEGAIYFLDFAAALVPLINIVGGFV